MSEEYLPLLLRRGDSFRRKIQISNADGLVNLSGSFVTLHIRRPGDQIDTLSVPFTVDDAPTGQVSVVLSPTQTAMLDPTTTYYYVVKFVASNGDITTITEGTLFISSDS